MSIWRDLVHAGRSLAKARAFTAVCVVSLGIGMAPVIAIPYGFRIFTTPPSGVDTDALVELVTTRSGPRRADDNWSWPDFIDLRDAETGVSLIGWATGRTEVIIPASREPATISALFVSSNYFRTIGVALVRGPGFQETTDPAVILGHDFWQNRLSADPDIVGKTLTLDGVPHDVVGIAPVAFGGHLAAQDAELFVPLERHPRLLADDDLRFDRSQDWVRIHGRLSAGVSVAQASAAVAAITAQLARLHPATNEFKSGIVEPYHPIGSEDGEDFTVIRTVWQTLATLPLLVVCLNISGMVQVRSAIRERELSIRQAIGASRGRLIQHLLAEAVVLAALGGTLASLVLFNLPPLMSWWAGEPIPTVWREALRVDLSMIAICVGLCLATSLVFGWLPAARFSRPVIMTVLKDEAGGGGVRAGRVHRVTAALQAAIAVPLLVMSATSLDRVRATATTDLGFEADLLYAAPLQLDAAADSGAGTGTDTGRVEHAAFQIRRVSDNLARATGVASVTVADGLPLDFRYRMTRVSLQANPDVAPQVVSVHVTRVGDGYLDTLGIPLLRGRGFRADDGEGTEMVTVISNALAGQLFPGVDAAEALGKRLAFGTPGADGRTRMLTIVGVTADFPTSQMSTERAQLLVPLAQYPDVLRDSVPVGDDRGSGPTVMLVARSAAGEPPAKLTAALENAIREVDPDFKSTAIVTGAWLRRHSMDDFLTQSAVAGISGGVVLMLAALGMYGVVGLMVSTRTREIAVRVTLGASRPRLMGMILLDVVKLVVPGVVVGLLIAAALVRHNGGVLGLPLSRMEPLAYVVGPAIAVLIAVLASLGPARRAASVQPMVAMRST
jgi:predicted permease